MLWPVSWSEATGTVGSEADKGSERDAGSAERWYCWPTGTGTCGKVLMMLALVVA